MRSGIAARRNGSLWSARPRTAALLVAAAVIAWLGLSLAWNPGVTLTFVAAAYVLLLVVVGRAARERRHGTRWAATACLVGVVSALLVPLTWGMSLLLAAFVLPLAIPGLLIPGRGRWLALLALLINAALTVLFALIWLV